MNRAAPVPMKNLLSVAVLELLLWLWLLGFLR